MKKMVNPYLMKRDVPTPIGEKNVCLQLDSVIGDMKTVYNRTKIMNSIDSM